MRFKNRLDAGHKLAQRVIAYAGRDDVVVLALPRGGVPVAYPVAQTLHAPLDLFIVRKLGVPGHEELAMGAIASGGVRVLLSGVVNQYRVTPQMIEQVTQAERQELDRRDAAYRGSLPHIPLKNKIVILVDDGLATGASMHAAVAAVREHHPARVIVAVPVAPVETREQFRDVADEIICLLTPEPFHAVGLWYEDFDQTTDDEVRDLLQRALAFSATSGDGSAV